jgi:hypothetical protein
MESARTKYQISPEIFLCSRSAFRECGVHGSEPVCHGNRLGGCRQEADFTVICLQGEAWARLSALLVKAGAKLETDCGADANGQRSVRMGAEAEYRKPPSSRGDSKPVQPHLYILQAERVAQLTQRPSPKNPEAMTTEARQGWKHTETAWRCATASTSSSPLEISRIERYATAFT